MEMTLAYRGRSDVVAGPGGDLAVALATNVNRPPLAYHGSLREPLRFREAIGALHDVVVSDLRYRPPDRTAYRAYRAAEDRREAEIRRGAAARERSAVLKDAEALAGLDVAALDRRYRSLRNLYWKARSRYSNHLARHDPGLWRLLVPCDPVITVAPDCLFFEGFSADESSYGCLTADRAAFNDEGDVALGTTNVDYSLALYEHFQGLRSYRATRFAIDPAGLAVQTDDHGGLREEKIDLPPSWLNGFMQVQAAMSLPLRRLPIGREGLYNVLAFLRRHRAARSPRAIRFELRPGAAVEVVLEPWERRLVLHPGPYAGPREEVVRIWGRDRLRVLARLLPWLDEAEVYLLGTGLPSFWSIRMGHLRFVLGLSGWTANDWTGTTALDQLAPPADPPPGLMAEIAGTFGHDAPTHTLGEICRRTGASTVEALAGLNRLALRGQVVHDLHAGVYRWRPVMPEPLAEAVVGPGSPETAGGRALVLAGQVHVTRDERRPDGLRVLEGNVPDRPVSLLLDADGRMLRGQCTCSHHHTGGLRRGPCRHLQALRDGADRRESAASLDGWLAALGLM